MFGAGHKAMLRARDVRACLQYPPLRRAGRTVRHGSVTRGARAVNLTQPALTQAIARLEADLGCALFERGASGMTPTEPARLLAPRAEAAIAHVGSPRLRARKRAFRHWRAQVPMPGAAETTGLSAASAPPRGGRSGSRTGPAAGGQARRRSILLTPQGERRARGFGLAMAELRNGLAEVAAWQGKAAGRIVVGAMPLSRARWLPRRSCAFMGSIRGLPIAVVEGSHAELARAAARWREST